MNANSAVWLDYDRDGRLDLFLAGYWPEDVDLWHLKTTRIMPESFEYAENGGRKYLLHNRGDGTFEEVDRGARASTSRRWTLAVGGRRSARHRLSRSVPGERLRRLRSSTPIEAASGSSTSARETGVGADAEERHERRVRRRLQRRPPVDLQDEHLRARRARAGQRSVGAEEARQAAGRPGSALEFEDLASSLGVDLGGWSWGAQFGDLNNDGTLDLYLVNGYVSAGERSSYWYDFAADRRRATARSSATRRTGRPMKGRSLSGLSAQARLDQRRRSAGSPTSRRSSASPTPTTAAPSRSPICPNRGVARRHRRQSARTAARSTRTPCSRAATGSSSSSKARASNRSAIGARVELHWNGQTQVQEVSGGSGFSAQNQRRLHYGLGAGDGRRSVVIRWPSGRHQTIDAPAVDRCTASGAA